MPSDLAFTMYRWSAYVANFYSDDDDDDDDELRRVLCFIFIMCIFLKSSFAAAIQINKLVVSIVVVYDPNKSRKSSRPASSRNGVSNAKLTEAAGYKCIRCCCCNS